MDQDYDGLRFVCKLCDKRFPSGKSLGGHMRSHVIAAANSPELDENGNPNSSSYGLRENPKRSWRASSSLTLPSPNDRICKQCGKGFQSLKALCGHMAFHSEKYRSLKAYDYSWAGENIDLEDKLVGGNYSDTEEKEYQDPFFVTGSKSKRYKKVVIKPSSFYSTNANSNTSNYSYGSSSFSELDELEQEDVAMCLMMLSKDSTNWSGVRSVVLDKKELSYEEKQEIRRNLFREFGYDNSLNKRIQDDDGSYKRNKYKCLNCSKTFSSFQGLGGHRPCHQKNNAFTPCGISSVGAFARDQKAKFENKMKPKKNKGHECPICFRMFKSGQALGGHKRSHFINASEDRIDHMAAMEHAVATYTNIIDLNLPAPEED